jgi:hypothetical protein
MCGIATLPQEKAIILELFIYSIFKGEFPFLAFLFFLKGFTYYYKLYLASFSLFLCMNFLTNAKNNEKKEYFVAYYFIGHQTQELMSFVCTLHRLQNYNLLVKIIKIIY